MKTKWSFWAKSLHFWRFLIKLMESVTMSDGFRPNCKPHDNKTVGLDGLHSPAVHLETMQSAIHLDAVRWPTHLANPFGSSTVCTRPIQALQPHGLGPDRVGQSNGPADHPSAVAALYLFLSYTIWVFFCFIIFRYANGQD